LKNIAVNNQIFIKIKLECFELKKGRVFNLHTEEKTRQGKKEGGGLDNY